MYRSAYFNPMTEHWVYKKAVKVKGRFGSTVVDTPDTHVWNTACRVIEISHYGDDTSALSRPKSHIACLFKIVFKLTTKKTPKLRIAVHVTEIHRSPVDPTHKDRIMWKVFPCHDDIMARSNGKTLNLFDWASRRWSEQMLCFTTEVSCYPFRNFHI